MSSRCQQTVSKLLFVPLIKYLNQLCCSPPTRDHSPKVIRTDPASGQPLGSVVAAKMQERNIEIANEGRKVPNFQPNDLVHLLSQPMMQQRSAKLHFRYTGPYRIVRRHRDNVFEIEGLDGRKKAKVVNVMNLKRYYSRQDFTLQCEKVLRLQQIQLTETKIHNSQFTEELSPWPRNLDILCITFVPTDQIKDRSDIET